MVASPPGMMGQGLRSEVRASGLPEPVMNRKLTKYAVRLLKNLNVSLAIVNLLSK